MIEGNYTTSGWGSTGQQSGTWAVTKVIDTAFFPDNCYDYLAGDCPNCGRSCFIVGMRFPNSAQDVTTNLASGGSPFDHFTPLYSHGIDVKLDDGDPSKGRAYIFQNYELLTYSVTTGAIASQIGVQGISPQCCQLSDGTPTWCSVSNIYNLPSNLPECTLALEFIY